MLNQWPFVILLCATLGLAPFMPEPHLVEKVRWIIEGYHQLQPMDWFDVLFHGAPWILLIRLTVKKLMALRKNE
ncbi:MAG: hypothetical protein OCC49_07775 [Fibrobacterales bacterium]